MRVATDVHDAYPVRIEDVSYEAPSYEVVARRRGYEIRRYDSYLVAETVVAGTFDGTGSQAFRRLAGYIFGHNSASKKMAMTVPVTRTPVDGGYEYRFVMERAYTEDTLPEPRDDLVVVRRVPAGVYAAARYRGTHGEHRFGRHRDSLLQALERDGIAPIGEAVAAAYNGPYTPPPLRHNEVLVPIQWQEANSAVA